jgi:hypothetical protein
VRHSRFDGVPWLLILTSSLCGLAVLSRWPTGDARIGAGVALTLVLPACAGILTARRFMPDYPPHDIVIVGAASGVALTIAGAVAIAASPAGLDRTSSACLFTAGIVLNSLVCLKKGREAGDGAFSFPRIPIRVVAAALPVSAILAGSYVWAVRSADTQARRLDDTSLWMLRGSGGAIDIGVQTSNDRRDRAYRLVLRVGSRSVRSWDIHMRGNEVWRTQVVLGRAARSRRPLLVLTRAGDRRWSRAVRLAPIERAG